MPNWVLWWLPRRGNLRQGLHPPARAYHLALNEGSASRSFHYLATPTFPTGAIMTSSTTQSGQIPTDPNTLAGLLLLAAAVIGQLSPDQRDTLSQVLVFATTIAPFLPRGGR